MGKSLGETGRTLSRAGLRVSGRRRETGLCAAVPGLQRPRRESAVRAFPQAGKPSRRTQAPLSFLTHLSPGTYSGALKTPPPHRGPGSAAAPGTGLDVPAFWELVALRTSHSPRLDGLPLEPAFPIRPLPHVIRIPPGELANILIYVLEAFFGLF